MWLAAACARSGKLEEAGWEADQVLILNPEFSLQRIRASHPFAAPEVLKRFIGGLRLAGL